MPLTEENIVAELNIVIPQGATWQRVIYLKDSNNVAVNLTGYTARMKVRPDFNSGVIIAISSPSDGITIDALTGTITLTISATATTLLSGNALAAYDIEIESAGGVVTRIMQGSVNVSAEITK